MQLDGCRRLVALAQTAFEEVHPITPGKPASSPEQLQGRIDRAMRVSRSLSARERLMLFE
jgi:hypothetical protein